MWWYYIFMSPTCIIFHYLDSFTFSFNFAPEFPRAKPTECCHSRDQYFEWCENKTFDPLELRPDLNLSYVVSFLFQQMAASYRYSTPAHQLHFCSLIAPVWTEKLELFKHADVTQPRDSCSDTTAVVDERVRPLLLYFTFSHKILQKHKRQNALQSHLQKLQWRYQPYKEL